MKLKRLIATLTVILLALSTTTASAIVHGPGSFYTQFSGDGAVQIDIPRSDAGDYGVGLRAAHTDNLDRLVVGVTDDSGFNIYLQRLTASGEIDTTFNDSRIECGGGQNATYIRDVKTDISDNAYAIIDCGASESAVVKLLGTNGEYDQQFGSGGFLWLSEAIGARTSTLNSITIGTNDQLYVLAQIEDSDGDIVNGVWKFSSDGEPSNYPSQSTSNQITLSVNDDELCMGSNYRSGILAFDFASNDLVITGRNYVGPNRLTGSDPEAAITDVWITRVDESGLLGWDENQIYWTTGLDASASSPTWNTHNYVVNDITFDDAGWVTIVGSDIHNYDHYVSFGLQVKPNVEDFYRYDFNGESDNYCSANTVMADERNGFYVAGSCDSQGFLQRYNSNGSRDLDFQAPSGNLTPYSGEFYPGFFAGSHDAISLTGLMFTWPLLNQESNYYSYVFVKYRKVAYDDEPVIQPTNPAGEPTTPAVEPTTPAVGPTTPAVEPTTPAVGPTNPAVEPTNPALTPAAPTAPAVKALPTLGAKKKLAAKSLATQIGMTVTPKAKVKLKVAKVSRKICKVSGGKLVALKPGNCSVTVSVTPKKTKQVKKPKTTKQSTVVVIS
jgi:hypothetical protein